MQRVLAKTEANRVCNDEGKQSKAASDDLDDK